MAIMMDVRKFNFGFMIFCAIFNSILFVMYDSHV